MNSLHTIAAVALSLLVALPAAAQAIPVEVVRTQDGWQLLRGGEPYHIKGGGGRNHLDVLAESGGNSIRTWGHDELEPREWPDGRVASLLDIAHEKGLTVTAGFWMGHPRHGFDYDDEAAVQAQIEEAVAFVRRWKDHPAILMWGVGNEVGLDGGHERVFREINRVAAAIKAEDPNHPTMTAIAGVWPDQGALFARLCPDVDVLGVNAYGGLIAVPQTLLNQGYDGPYVVTEYGPIGHWECATTPWGAPVEQPSAGKARHYRESHDVAITNQPDRCLGSYAFLWGQKQERTETWYGMFLKTGEKLQPVDVMAELWTGSPPANRCPHVERIASTLALATVAPGSVHQASVPAHDPDGDALTFRWLVKRESTDRRSGGDSEREPPVVDGCIVDSSGATATVRAPDEPGEYRLFVFVYDGKNAAGTANTPFRVR